MGDNSKQLRFDVVLSGSGVNFNAHVGALTALEEVGEIVSITGVSGGALIAAHYALYQDLDKLKALALGVKLSALVTRKFSFLAVLQGYLYASCLLDKFLKDVFQDSTLRNTQIPLTIVAADCNKQKAVIFSSLSSLHQGPSVKVFDAVRASMAAPTIFKPHLGLVDGGIVNNMPIDLAAEHIHRQGNELIGIKVRPARTTEEQNEGYGTFKLVGILKKTINTLIASLDYEHMEENADKVVFVECPNSAFDFSIPPCLKFYHYWTGRQKTLEFLTKRYGFTHLKDHLKFAKEEAEVAKEEAKKYLQTL